MITSNDLPQETDLLASDMLTAKKTSLEHSHNYVNTRLYFKAWSPSSWNHSRMNLRRRRFKHIDCKLIANITCERSILVIITTIMRPSNKHVLAIFTTYMETRYGDQSGNRKSFKNIFCKCMDTRLDGVTIPSDDLPQEIDLLAIDTLAATKFSLEHMCKHCHSYMDTRLKSLVFICSFFALCCSFWFLVPGLVFQP